MKRNMVITALQVIDIQKDVELKQFSELIINTYTNN